MWMRAEGMAVRIDASVFRQAVTAACGLVLLLAGYSAACAAEPLAPRRAATEREVATAVAELRASNAELRRNEREYRTQREQGRLSDADALEFAEFVAGLRHRMFADCVRLQDLGGDASEHALDCEEDPQGAQEALGIAVLPNLKPALTEAEKAELLDRDLRKIEAELDDLLMTRQDELRRIEQSRPPRESSTAQGQSGGGGNETANGSAKTAGGSAGTGNGSEQSEGQGEGGITGGSSARVGEPGAGLGRAKQGAGQRAPRSNRVAGGVDDDVLARQLREAAENETDPILRDKLWDEYRKYKESIR
jgi:hypothetical protein